jgi:hypothetical protein
VGADPPAHQRKTSHHRHLTSVAVSAVSVTKFVTIVTSFAAIRK